jgi:hypothetical protein
MVWLKRGQRGLSRVRLLLILILAVCAAGQPVSRNRLTFSGGWSRDIGGVSFERKSATSLGLSYGRRVWKYAEAEVGVFTALDPTGDICSAHGCVDANDNFLWIPFGLRFLASLAGGRVEVSAGGGGLFERYRTENPFFGGVLPAVRTAWGGYFAGGAAVALDRGRHVWLGAAPRWFLANPPYDRDRWFQITGEVSVRFK